jgi:hypothetical protein
MKFYPYESVEIPKKANGLVNAEKEAMQDFWSEVNENEDNLDEGIGCYIFSIRAGKGVLPWYVGLAEKQTFRKECFTSHKLNHYNDAIAKRKGTPLLTLIAKHTPNGKLVRPSGVMHRDIQFLEAMLISNCVSRNSSLYNVRDTKLLREMVVPGLINTPQGKTTAAVTAFRSLIGV